MTREITGVADSVTVEVIRPWWNTLGNQLTILDWLIVAGIAVFIFIVVNKKWNTKRSMLRQQYSPS